MNQKTKDPSQDPHKPEQAYPDHAQQAKEQREKAEADEVAGRQDKNRMLDHQGGRKQ